MPDLHAWITQQIDETERIAHRAAELCGCHPPKPSWSFLDGDEPTDGRILIVDEPHPSLKRKIGRRWNGSYEGLSMAEHIVRHHPGAVLRRCAADRKILEVHAPQGGDWEPYACLGCGTDSEYGVLVDHTNDCETLHALAEGYGLTGEQRAQLDRPEPEPRQRRMGGLLGAGIVEVMYGDLITTFINARPVESRPEVKAIQILGPELKKISGYVPTTNPEA